VKSSHRSALQKHRLDFLWSVQLHDVGGRRKESKDPISNHHRFDTCFEKISFPKHLVAEIFEEDFARRVLVAFPIAMLEAKHKKTLSCRRCWWLQVLVLAVAVNAVSRLDEGESTKM
jgi:hypothetical protein